MAKVIFSLTTAQVAALMRVKKDGTSAYSDHGAARGCATKGWIRPKKKNEDVYWCREWELTKKGVAIIVVIDTLHLDRQASGPEELGP